jgi:hypothetical protein
VKGADPAAAGSTFQVPPGRLRISNRSLRQIIETAWHEFGDVQIPRALHDRLGFRLESAKGPQQILVIDSVRKPNEN